MDLEAARQVPVWDRFVRSSHWVVAFATPVAYLSHGGLLGAHRLAGYAIAIFVAARLVWGVIGSHHARFASFVTRPGRLAGYLGSMLRGREPRYLGHNPAGAAMIVLLLLLLVAVSASGLLLDTPSFRDDRDVQGWHQLAADALMIAAGVHLCGVVYASVRHRENLIGAMVTGKKRD